MEQETRVELATLCLGSLCCAFRIYTKLQMPELARLGPKPPEAEALCLQMVRNHHFRGQLGPTMTQRQAIERDGSTNCGSVQELTIVPPKLPKLNWVFEAAQIRLAEVGEQELLPGGVQCVRNVVIQDVALFVAGERGDYSATCSAAANISRPRGCKSILVHSSPDDMRSITPHSQIAVASSPVRAASHRARSRASP